MMLVYNYNPCKSLHLNSNYVPIITKITAKRVEYLLKLLATTGLDSKLKILVYSSYDTPNDIVWKKL